MGILEAVVRIVVVTAVLAAALVAATVVALLDRAQPTSATSSPAAQAGPDATWAPGARPAPDFALSDQNGIPVSVARFRGRPVIVTFIDPVCQDLCPLEAHVLSKAQAEVPTFDRAAVLAVSVNEWANARSTLLADMRRWQVGSEWHWAIGPAAALARVWRAYQVTVFDQPKRVHGRVEHNVVHTEASFLVDRRGDVRALYVYPFAARDVARTLRQVAG